MQSQHIPGKAYSCPLAQTQVYVQLKQNIKNACQEPEVCSNIGECGCGVVQIIYGMSYTVDWKKCCLYSTING